MTNKWLKLTLFSLFVLIFILAGFIYKFDCNNNAKRIYKQGMRFYAEKNYSDAFYNFKQIKCMSDLYALSLLKQYQCARNLADKKTAHQKLLKLIKHTNDDNICPYALYQEALLASELNTASKIQQYKKFKKIYITYPNSDFAIASAYKMGVLLENKNKIHSREKFIEYLEYAPSGKFSTSAIKKLINLDIILSESEYEIIANSFLENQKYEEAIKAYKLTQFSKNWYNISKCYRGLKQTEEEKKVIEKGLELKISTVDEKDISSAIDRLITLNQANKVQLLQDLYTKYGDTYIYPTICFKLAENSNSIRSIKLYEKIMNSYPKSIWASNSLWEVFWYNYKLSRYQTCISLARKHIESYEALQDGPRLSYWYGKVLLKNRQNQEAKEAFYETIKKYPISYYAFLSARQLKMSRAKKMIIKKQIASYNINSLNKYLFKDKLILQLADNGDFETIDDLKINDDFVKSWTLNKKRIYPRSINTAKNALIEDQKPKEIEIKTKEDKNQSEIKFSDYRLKLVYPIIYEQIVNSESKHFNQSPYLFLSLIREESHFNKEAKSAVGAMGLTQLMQPTANFIEKTQVPKETLLIPEENIRIGLKYFTYLVDMFNKNEFLAILSYNAGPGNVKKWLQDTSVASNEIDEFVENIPYLETKNYIKKILSSYWTYINIYSSKNRGI